MLITGRTSTSTSRRLRALILTLGVLAVAACAFVRPAAAFPDASASIIHGDSTSISKWPWQVALARSSSMRPGSPWFRTFCGGSLVAPNMVLTAAHCAYEMRRNPTRFTVISGRTNLDDTSRGRETRVSTLLFPRAANGMVRYRQHLGWDVALLELSAPLDQQLIQLLGPEEGDASAAGTRLTETGWGTTITGSNFSPKTLKEGGTNVQPDWICRGLLGAPSFTTRLQICLGDARGRQANCYGDSGGPAMVQTTAGFRQVGITSSGTARNCAGTIPNVDVLAGGGAVRDWVRSVVLSRTGVDPVGSGGSLAPPANLCRIPSVAGKRGSKARQAILDAGCGKVRIRHRGRGNRVLRNPAPAGWLWDAATPIRLVTGG